MRQSALTYMLNYKLSKKLQKNIDKCFVNWDKEGSGKITKPLFVEGYRELYAGLNQDVATLRAVEDFDKIDANNELSIYFDDWSASIIHKNDQMVEEFLNVGFTNFDEEGRGDLSINEVVSIMAKSLREFIGEEETWRKIVKDADADGDGRIDFGEFKEMMQNI